MKKFPCWVCRGLGKWIEPVTDEGFGPTEYCGYCEGKGLIEVGGKRHREIVAEGIALKIIKFVNPEQIEWTHEELIEIGNKALSLVPAPTKTDKEDITAYENPTKSKEIG